MPSYDSKELPFVCPNPKCKKQMKVVYRDIFSSRRTKCSSCGTEVNFNSSAVSDFKSALDDMVKTEDNFKNERKKAEDKYKDDVKRAEEKISKAIGGIMKNAEVKMKM